MMKRDEQRIAIPASNISGEVRKHRKQVFTQLRKEDIYYDLYTLGAAGPMVMTFVQSNTKLGKTALDVAGKVAKSFSAKHTNLPNNIPNFVWMETLDFPDIVPSFMAQFGFQLHERYAEIGLVDLRSQPAGALWFPIDDQALTVKNVVFYIHMLGVCKYLNKYISI